MRFPKPIVYLGFILIAVAVLGSIVEAIFKEEKKVQTVKESPREIAAGMIVDKLFEQLKEVIKKDGLPVKEELMAELKKTHKTVYVKKYIFIAEELDRKKHTDQESQQINEEFNKNTINSLAVIYKRKLKSSDSKK